MRIEDTHNTITLIYRGHPIATWFKITGYLELRPSYVDSQYFTHHIYNAYIVRLYRSFFRYLANKYGDKRFLQIKIKRVKTKTENGFRIWTSIKVDNKPEPLLLKTACSWRPRAYPYIKKGALMRLD